MNKRWPAIAVLALLLAFPPMVLADSATVTDAGENRYKSVELTPEVYHRASADLSDLRLYDAAGEPVPYFLHQNEPQQTEQRTEVPLNLVTMFTKDNAMYFGFQAEQDDPLTDLSATSVRFEATGGSFAKNATLYGSYDGVKWDLLCEDTLYRVEGKEQMELALPGVQKYGHYRVALANNLEKVGLTGGTLCYSVRAEQASRLVGELDAAFTEKKDGRSSVLTLTGLKNLRLTELTLVTDGMFRRSVRSPLGSKELYQVQFEDTAYRDLTLPLGGRVWDEDTLALTIDNGDDKPLTIDKVLVHYATDELIFAGTSGPYRLTFGEPMDAPEYDIMGYSAQVLEQPIDRLTLSAVQMDAPAEEPKPSVDPQTIFNYVLIAVAFLLGAIILLRIQKSSHES